MQEPRAAKTTLASFGSSPALTAGPAGRGSRALSALCLGLGMVLAFAAGPMISGPSGFGLDLAPAPVFADDPPTPPPPTPTATAVADTGICSFEGEHRAGSNSIEIGWHLPMSFTIRADCPEGSRGRADILVVVDYSSSMRDDNKFDAAQSAVRQFVDNVDFERHRVGLVPFSDSAHIAQPLTDNRDYLIRAIENSGGPSGGTDIGAALRTADRELAAAARREAVSIIVLLTDGKSSAEPMREAARVARDRGVVIFSIGLGSDAEEGELERIANTPAHYYFAPGPGALSEIYLRIAEMIRSVAVTDIVVVSRLAPQIDYAPGKGRPREPVIPEGGDELQWPIAFIAADDVTLAYELIVRRGGQAVLPSELAYADYTDGDGTRRRYVFEPPSVEVIVPDTHTIHLPLLYQRMCVPSKQWSDVALVLDISSSMTGPKLNAAVGAAAIFIDLLKLPRDRASIITYSTEAEIVSPLTGDRDALQDALGRLSVGSGTRLDRGLLKAADALQHPAERRDNRPVVILLTDGRQSVANSEVEAIASMLRSQGITIFTIAFGEDADRALLERVAGRKEQSFFAPDATTLVEIYQSLAELVGCK
jgi:Mg-chelatase subunit ChlD